MEMSYYFSKPFLLSKPILNLFIWVNLAGTVYGYYWYWEQIKQTMEQYPWWYVLFVPDSPTASLFFTAGLVFLWFVSGQAVRTRVVLRKWVEAYAVVSSIKYGVWAVTMILEAANQGDPLIWQDWMLIFSHLGMAVEGFLFAFVFTYEALHVAAAEIVLLFNDYMDYGHSIYPWLPNVLLNDLPGIAKFTIFLSLFSFIIGLIISKIRRIKRV
ncbi:MAG: hypothetical protein A2189_07950 [Paenibacillus sp. RIFOXYA1_FULL_44_5]|nr:MAG: hypothetical protein A2189_07950 [Paenibacillus sp. RIFOXYA1_FULL_44_5]